MSATNLISVEVPDIGDFADVPVIELHVGPGDHVAVDDPLLTLESDKATMDVPSPFAGVVRELLVKVGDTVSQGTALLTMEPADGDSVSEPFASDGSKASAVASDGAPNEAAAPDAIAGALAAEPPATEPAPAPPAVSGPVYASPSVRRLARERGIDLSTIAGTGRKGRITPEDLERAGTAEPLAAPVAAPAGAGAGLDLAPWPTVEFEKFGPIERVPRSRIQRISGPNLARNWVMIPHVTHHDEADITELEAWRRDLNVEQAANGVKVTMVSFLILAAVAALKEYPIFNASLDGEDLVLKRYYNIGFAADTPGGLVVPVIREADRKGLLTVAAELSALSAKAREGKLGPADMQGSTFTISSLGGIGGTGFTPIINAPEVAILGVTKAATRPVWNGHEFVPRLTVPLSLSYDHRVIDGAAAARFVVDLVRVLSDLRRALL